MTSIPPGSNKRPLGTDLLRWFEEDPRFQAIWSQYKFSRRIGCNDLYVPNHE